MRVFHQTNFPVTYPWGMCMRIFVTSLIAVGVLQGCMKSDLESCIDDAIARIEEERAEEIPNWPPGAMDIVRAGYKQQCLEMLYSKK